MITGRFVVLKSIGGYPVAFSIVVHRIWFHTQAWDMGKSCQLGRGQQMTVQKMNWLRLETRLRNYLRDMLQGDIDKDTCLAAIDNALGEETGRGYELPENWVNLEKI